VSQGHISASGLVSFIQTATTKLRAAGYNGVISTAEIVSTFQSNPSLCSCLDSTVSAQIHPFFDPNTQPSDAGTFVLSQIQLVKSACGGKTVIVSETGWPSSGASKASTSDQATAIASLKSIVGSADITFFSFTDDYWKAGAAVEQAFGMVCVIFD
jgi:exo-beta-1,3-glucanase (GH17 family)